MNLREDPEEFAPPTTWEEYARLVVDPMSKLARGEITAYRCYELFPLKPSFVSKEVHEFIAGVASEVDHPESGFRELLELLERGATEERIVEFMDWLG